MVKMKQDVVTKKMFIWNIIGSAINSAASFVLLAFVTRNVSIQEAGYFSIAFSTAQLLLSFGKFGVRAFQATDVNNQISRRAFIVHRIITSLGMMVLSILYILLSECNFSKAAVIICVCGIKVVDAIEDVFHGELQLNGRMDIAGKLLTFRNVLTIVFFAFSILKTHNLILTCLFTAIGSLVVCMLMNVYAVKQIERDDVLYRNEQVGGIFKECAPLFIGSFLSILVYNMPKYAIDSLGTEHIQTVYNIIFMPAFAINMMSEFVFKPLLTPLALCWSEKDLEKVKRIIIKLLLCLVGITVFVLVGGFILGIPILELVYNIKLGEYKKELMILLLGGGFSATVYLAYNLLTMMRAQKNIFVGYVGGATLATIFAWVLVADYGITGAALTYLSVEFFMCGYFLFAIKRAIKKHGE